MTNISREKGMALIREMQGEAFANGIAAAANSGGFGADAAAMAIEGTFGGIWAREGLARRDRSLVVLGILLAQGHVAELKNHIRFGLNNGLSMREIEEVLYQAQPYAGWPAVSQGLEAAVAVFRERGLMADQTQTSEERGLL